MSKHSTKQQGLHIFWVFIVYFVVIFLILALINYMIFPLMYIFSLAGISLLVAAVATFFHWRTGQRSGVDDIADKFGR